jgi:2-oxoglutarate ferredoxin oxidoreductase subunit alpha
MTIIDVQRSPAQGTRGGEVVVNDFAINVASINGSGSQTSNLAIIRALFKMGIPVSGKNLFPSNIQGMPTWFFIRLSKDGYVGRKEGNEILVAWSQQTFGKDVSELPPGGVLIYPLDWKVETSRDDLHIYRIPIKDLMDQFDIPRDLKSKVANMIYVGALVYLLGIEMAEVEHALSYELKGKRKAIDLNLDVVKVAAAWAAENWDANEMPFRAERVENSPNADKFLLDGNSAAAMGAMFGGVSFIAWYPITPSTSLVDAARGYLKQYRHDADGKPTYAIVQAEDELAAIGMVLGAGWMGARAMTATSGPGISLMAEFASLGFFAELPGVIWDIQRVGPSTGLPTRTSQGDVLFAHFLGHGDTRQICLLPGSIEECFQFGWEAFDYAERFQTPVFVLSDLDLGMNIWTSSDFEYPDRAMDRGKVLTAEDIQTPADFIRFRDKDGDGVGARTLPGNPNPLSAAFVRGTGHNEAGAYSENNEDWQQNLARLFKKIELTRDKLPAPIVHYMDGAAIGIISYGSNDPAIQEARDLLAAEGIKTDYLRIRALPLASAVLDFVHAYDHVYVVENNQDAQMTRILRMDVPEKADRILPINMCDGLPLTAQFISQTLLEMEG